MPLPVGAGSSSAGFQGSAGYWGWRSSYRHPRELTVSEGNGGQPRAAEGSELLPASWDSRNFFPYWQGRETQQQRMPLSLPLWVALPVHHWWVLPSLAPWKQWKPCAGIFSKCFSNWPSHLNVIWNLNENNFCLWLSDECQVSLKC